MSEPEGLLSAVLSGHLVLCRAAVLYPWKSPFYSGAKTYSQDAMRELVDSLLEAWDLLGVSGIARRRMLERLVLEAGQQTLEARRQINENHYKQLEAGSGTTGDIRGAAALNETEGEDQTAWGKPTSSGVSVPSRPCTAW